MKERTKEKKCSFPNRQETFSSNFDKGSVWLCLNTLVIMDTYCTSKNISCELRYVFFLANMTYFKSHKTKDCHAYYLS